MGTIIRTQRCIILIVQYRTLTIEKLNEDETLNTCYYALLGVLPQMYQSTKL